MAACKGRLRHHSLEPMENAMVASSGSVPTKCRGVAMEIETVQGRAQARIKQDDATGAWGR